MKELLEILTLAAVLGSGLVAGIFFAFSTFVMRALGILDAELAGRHGADARQGGAGRGNEAVDEVVADADGIRSYTDA